ncbi:MAG: hypothetical protein OJF48_001725 [Afipia sp.]|nr:MAG: hypothetical protein OJF48_001725 [Afipia sp.]
MSIPNGRMSVVCYREKEIAMAAERILLMGAATPRPRRR